MRVTEERPPPYELARNAWLLKQVPAKALDLEHISQLTVEIREERILGQDSDIELIDRRGLWEIRRVRKDGSQVHIKYLAISESKRQLWCD